MFGNNFGNFQVTTMSVFSQLAESSKQNPFSLPVRSGNCASAVSARKY